MAASSTAFSEQILLWSFPTLLALYTIDIVENWVLNYKIIHYTIVQNYTIGYIEFSDPFSQLSLSF